MFDSYELIRFSETLTYNVTSVLVMFKYTFVFFVSTCPYYMM